MATLTPNLQLIKPDGTDNISISDLNSNFETIDQAITDIKVDYVIAQGVQNGWTYRRWASGIQECWARVPVSFTTNIGWGTMYRTEVGLYKQTYPVTFVSTPTLIRSFDSDSGTSWALASSGASASSTGGTMFANPVKGSSERGYLSFHAKGRWK